MSDLIRRQDALDTLNAEFRNTTDSDDWDGLEKAMQLVSNIPSAEPERTAKVIEHDASITDTDGNKYQRSEYLCGNCKKKVLGGDEYCSHCGARLEWK